MIDYSNNNFPRLLIENVQTGAKINELVNLISSMGQNAGLLKSLICNILTRDVLKQLKNKMGGVSEFVFKIDRGNILSASKMGNGLFSGMESAAEQFLVEYVEIKMKFDYKIFSNAPIQNEIKNLVSSLIKKPSQTQLFEQLKVKAQNIDSNKLEAFDLLIDKVKVEVSVQKREKYRTVLSEHMFSLMYEESTKNHQT